MRKAIVIEYDDVETFDVVKKVGFATFGERMFTAMMQPDDWRNSIGLGAVYNVTVTSAKTSE